jgi:hypothetical protein
MSLTKHPSTTEKNRAARQRNGRQSRGPATPEGKERSRSAHLRHGYYSCEREQALRALGEDPAELDALHQAAHAEYQPQSDFQARIADRLTRLWWRMERAERIQENLAAREMQRHEEFRREEALRLRQKANPGIELLELLMEAPADARFYTPRGYFQMFARAFGDKPEGTLKEILLRLHWLRKPAPEAEEPGEDGAAESTQEPTEVTTEEALEDAYLTELADLEGVDFPLPWPEIPPAEGEVRDEVREELRQMAKFELEVLHAVVDPELDAQEIPLSQTDRDEVQAAAHRHAELMRREEESCFRQFMRLGTFLLMTQDRARKRAQNEGSSGYVYENAEEGESASAVVGAEQAASAQGESEVRSPKPEVAATEAESRVRSMKSEVAEACSGLSGVQLEV